MLPHSRLRLSACYCSGVCIGEKKPQHTRQIGRISWLEREAGIRNHFPVFGNVASQHADRGAHSVQKSQREAFQVRGQDEEGGIGEQFIESRAVNPVEENYLFALM